MLIIVGKPGDVEKYKKQRGVVAGYDPATGQPVAYGGLKLFGNKANVDNNPFVKYGAEYRVGLAQFKTVPIPGRKGYGDDDRITIAGIANENAIDRYNERLDPAGVITTEFVKNPVLLVDHYYSSAAVVGRVEVITPEHDGVKFEGFVGDPKAVGGIQNLTIIQRDTRSLVAQGLLQTVSVGFIPKKIQAPVYDEDGKQIEPAIILQWELLELSIVAIPANPGSLFEMKQVAHLLNVSNGANPKTLTADGITGKNGEDLISELKSSDTIGVLFLEFDAAKFDIDAAKAWATERGFKAAKTATVDGQIRIAQRDPVEIDQDTLKTLELADGVKAVIGNLNGVKEMNEEQAKEMIDLLKAIATAQAGVADALKALASQNEKILAKLGGDDAGDSGGGDDEKAVIKAATEKNTADIVEIKSTLDKIDAVIGKIFEKVNV